MKKPSEYYDLKAHKPDPKQDSKWMRERSAAIASGEYRTMASPYFSGKNVEVRACIGKNGGMKVIYRFKSPAGSIKAEFFDRSSISRQEIETLIRESKAALRAWAKSRFNERGLITIQGEEPRALTARSFRK